MPHKRTVDVYMEIYNSLKRNGNPCTYLTSDGEGIFWYPYIPNKIKTEKRREFKLNPSEEILFVHNIPFLKVVITNIGLHYLKQCSINKYIAWGDIEEVEYSDNFLLFHLQEGNEPIYFFLSQFTKYKDDRNKAIAGEIYAELFTRMANAQSYYDELIDEEEEEDELQMLLNQEKEEKALALSRLIADLYFKKVQQSEAILLLDEAIENDRDGLGMTQNAESIICEVIKTLSVSPRVMERYSAELEGFKRRLSQLQGNFYRLGVIGVTSSGKSTMINSLLGERLLPAGSCPTSSQLVSCFRGKERYARIYFEDDTEKQLNGEDLTSDVIKQYGDEGCNEENKEKVRQIEISTPCFPFPENVVLVDSPGLDAFGYEGHEKLTMNSLLPTIDFCIFVTTCKTNSDEKTKKVLDTVADHRKPVVIVQNMIDSIKPSLDGMKTVADVAQEHKDRVQKIVAKSKIEDKASVEIVQISSIKALEAWECDDKVRRGTLLKESNHELLISSVRNVVKQFKPRIEGSRMENLRKEILRIADIAIKDGKESSMPMSRGYESINKKYEEYQQTKESNAETILKAIEKLKELKEKLEMHSSLKLGNLEENVEKIKSVLKSIENTICSQMRKLNERIIDVCAALNVDSRNIISDFRFEKTDVSIKKKEQVSAEWVEGERLWYTLWILKDEGYWETTTETVVDVDATKKNAIKSIERAISCYQRTMSSWGRSIDKTEEKMAVEVENRKQEFENRKKKHLDSLQSLEIGRRLQRIADTIPHNEIHTTSSLKMQTDVKNPKYIQAEVSRYAYSVYQLAERYKRSIHKSTIDTFINQDASNIVVGWDERCETKLAEYFFGDDLKYNNFRIVHKPTGSLTGVSGETATNYFILVNATQHGAALNEIASLDLNSIGENDVSYFVIQDFTEIINGESVDETLRNMLQISKDLNLRKKAHILLLDDNPIYNLVAIETQWHGRKIIHNDEIEIFDTLKKKFAFMYSQDSEKIIRSIIREIGKVWNE